MDTNQHVRKLIAKCLGGLWLIDGLLQLQPKMFGADFTSQVLAPNLIAQPEWLRTLVMAGIHAWTINPLVSDSAAAILQIAIGVLLLLPVSGKGCRMGLWISIVWGIVVWFCGEGAGLLLTGGASLYTGAPGAVLLYVLLAIVLLIPEKISANRLPAFAGWMLIAGSALQLQPVFWSASGLQGIVTGSMESIPALQVIPAFVSNLLSADPIGGNLILIVIPLVIGLLLVFKPNRITGGIALLFLFFVWWWGQDFGLLTTIFSGVSTDPDTAPLMALCLLPIFLA